MKNDSPSSRRGIVCHRGVRAGILEKTAEGYRFAYLPKYMARGDAEPISLTLPLRDEPFESEKMFPYFLGLIPEGWLLDLTRRILKVDPENVFEILLRCCKDCIGATSIYPDGGKEIQ